MEYTTANMLIRTTDASKTGLFNRVSADQIKWQYLNMVALRLKQNTTFEIQIDAYEYVAVILGGICNIKTSRGDFLRVGRRYDVFDGLPYAVYMPRQTDFTIEALTDDVEIVSCWSPTTRDHPLKLIKPEDIRMEVRGGGQATYQVNTIIGPEFDCTRLLAYETYTPGGNWSHYPPHKHDITRKDVTGSLLEANLEEIILYKFNRRAGFAYQHVYTEERDIDSVMIPEHNDVILVPKGYHHMVSPPGITTYSLHFLAGTSHDPAISIDPAYAWVSETWTQKDPRLPIVDRGMEPLKT